MLPQKMKLNDMSHNDTSTGGDDLGSTDEVKVFKDEGDREEEKNSSENLFEEKSSLIDLTESEFISFQKKNRSQSVKSDSSTPVFGKIEQPSTNFNMGYLMSHYGSYTNGPTVGNKIGIPQFFCHSNSEASLTTPPPAHCGIPPYQLDPKMIGLAGRPFFTTSPYPYPILSPDISPTQLGPSWHTPTVYAASNFKNPYSSSDFSFRFSSNLYHNANNPEGLVMSNSQNPTSSINAKQESIENYNNKLNSNRLPQQNAKDVTKNVKDSQNSKEEVEKKRPHIKKPLNAFMLYMKEMRTKVVNECTLKESAAINKILGQKWHELNREEQSKYYDKARRERQLHMELYPGWSARDNYGYVSKKKKHKKDRQPTDSLANTMKKCRARFGLDQQSKWCKPCRRKKKCIFYTEAQKSENNTESNTSRQNAVGGSDNYNLGSCSSVDDMKNTDDDADSFNQSLSSPGGFSNLSSMQSPATSVASHSNQITSPATPNSCQGEINQQLQHQLLQNTMQQKELQSSNSNFTVQLLSRKNNENETILYQNNISNFNSKSNDSDISKLKIYSSNTGALSTNINKVENVKDHPNSPIDDKSIINKMLTSIKSTKPQSEVSTPNNIQSSIGSNTKEITKNQNVLNSPFNSLSSLGSSVSPTISSIKSFSPVFEDPYANILTPKSDKQTLSSSLITRNPVGANPRDINNPLNIKQLTNCNDVVRSNSSPTSIPLQSPISSTVSTFNCQTGFPTTSIPLDNRSTFSHLENSINSFIRQHKPFSAHTVTPNQSHYHSMFSEASGVSFPQHIPHMGHYFGSMTTQSESLGLVNNQYTTDNFKKQSSNIVSADHIHKTVDSSSSENTGKSGAIKVT